MEKLGSDDGVCDKKVDAIDTACDDIHDLRHEIEEIPVSEYPELIEKNWTEYYRLWWDFWDVSKSRIECFLSENKGLELTPLGLADVLKNHQEFKHKWNLIIEEFDNYMDRCSFIS